MYLNIIANVPHSTHIRIALLFLASFHATNRFEAVSCLAFRIRQMYMEHCYIYNNDL